MTLTFWSLFLSAVLALGLLWYGAWRIAGIWLKDVTQDAAFVPPAIRPEQVLSGAETYERTRELLALTESSPLKARQPLIYRIH